MPGKIIQNLSRVKVKNPLFLLDEIDKIATSDHNLGRDVSGRGVQTGLLKLLEETEVPARSPNDISAQFQEVFQMRGGKVGKRTINTRHILFVVSGAFSGLPGTLASSTCTQAHGRLPTWSASASAMAIVRASRSP